MVPSLSLTTLLSLPALRLALAQSISLSPGTTAPNGASDYINPSFAGFGIEPSNLFSFTGADTANQFSVQLLQNLADYAGAPPHLRIGGNTQDYMIFNGSNTQFAWVTNRNSRAQGAIAADSMIIGPNYFKAIDRFPKDTPVTFGLNMAYMEDDYQDDIINMAQGAIDGLKNVKLYSFEVGNEPDLWLQNQFRAAPWNGQVYTNQWLDRCSVVYEQVLKGAGLPSSFFEAPATASTIGTTFEISQLVSDGIMAGKNGNNFLATWNQHDYFYCTFLLHSPHTVLSPTQLILLC
ncbi:glycoside hydrolase family 79 [Pyrenophora seminiperda CCB06]|uniref:Glycoside hydrolase family 79 n=1 Tax=Pyrenophora seminiperda CCB06 TaxID=1302712 RepID=A0A3M7MDK7_9PLEO|nr:glycoside hydrolase family 79 [Pyrenophora seminiperda CCB06]